jgi:hypothetical protein
MEYLLKASAVIVVFYLCFYFFLKRETFFNHNRWFLLIGIVIALIFPLVVIPVHIEIEPILTPNNYVAISENIPLNIQQPIPQPKFEWQKLLPILYVIGLSVFLIQFLFQFGSLIVLLIKNPKNKDGIYTYVIVNNKISPFSFFKWIVYNPKSFTDEELNLMLTHEKVHASQLHSLDILLIQLACSVFWFNPLIWFYRKEVRQNLEYIADYTTQEKLNSKIEYQRLLLKTSVANHNIALSNNFYNSSIKKRIVMLKKSRSNRKKQLRYLLVLPLLCGLLMSMNTEKVYVENESVINPSLKTLEFVVTKNTTDSELIGMSKAVEDKGGSLVFSKIKRNSVNELTSIFVKLYDHSYGGGNSDSPIDSFIIYKELFGSGGGYVGRINGSTMHFDKKLNTISENEIEKLKKRAYNAIIKNGVQTVNVDEQNSTHYHHIEIVFNKNMSDQDLENIKKELKSNDITMTIKRIKRNKEGEISDINIDFKTENGAVNYNVKDENGISPFYFNMKENGSFGVGAINTTKFAVAEEITKGKSKKDSSAKTRVFVFDNGDQKAFELDSIQTNVIVERHNHDVKILKEAIGSDTIYFSTIDSAEVKRLSKIKSNTYYQSDMPVKIIQSIESDKLNTPKTSYSSYSYYDSHNPKPLIIIDGKEGKEESLKIINPDEIEKLHVLKGDNAMELYGEKGKNGVIVITSKGKNTWQVKPKNKEESPWAISVVSNYVDDEDSSKNATLAYISKSSNDVILKAQKSQLEKLGIDVKYSKIKRNKNGDITRIKIALKNNQGDETTASYKDSDGITNIAFGISEGKLVIRSTKIRID